MPETQPPHPDDRLIDEMLGGKGAPQPELPVFLGEYTPEEASRLGLPRNCASAHAPELRGWDKYTPGESS